MQSLWWQIAIIMRVQLKAESGNVEHSTQGCAEVTRYRILTRGIDALKGYRSLTGIPLLTINTWFLTVPWSAGGVSDDDVHVSWRRVRHCGSFFSSFVMQFANVLVLLWNDKKCRAKTTNCIWCYLTHQYISLVEKVEGEWIYLNHQDTECVSFYRCLFIFTVKHIC